MKNIRYVLIVALLFSVGTSAIAQLKRANRRFDQLAYARAIFLYEKGLKKKSGNLEAMARLADCYRLTSDSKHAENWYKQVTKNRKSDPKNCFYYGQALMNNRKWEEASKWFEKYLDKKPGDKLAERALWSSKNHHEFVRDSSLYTVVPTNLNTAEADFGPSFYMDKELVFASARKPGRFEHSWTNRSFLDLYRADFSANRQGLGEAKRLDGQVNSKLHEGGQTFSSDGQVMFFSRNNFHRGKVGHSSEGVVRLKTFRADLKGGKWKNVTGIPFNDDEYSIGHPSLSSDGKTLYFVSDMPGGEGGTDLYKVKLSLKEELWGEPENLGPEINTSGNEMFPWISQDGHLYFASDGHEGLGGLDIFQVKNLAGNGIKVSNMGYPINSPRDDFSLVMDESTGKGFFSSNRIGGKGDDDIYMFTRRQEMKGIIADAETGETLEGVRVELHSIHGFENMSYSDEKGSFRQGVEPRRNYFLMISKDGYKQVKKMVSAKDIDPAKKMVLDVKLEKTPPCPEIAAPVVVFNEKEPVKDPGPIISGLGNVEEAEIDMAVLDSGKVFYIIYYDYDEYDIRGQDARPELDRLVAFMVKHPRVKVQMSSHTDARGSDSYNMRLSTNRAKEAYQYITGHGVEGGRLSWIPKGETELVNDCVNGVNCPDKKHQMNRRTEFMLNGKYIKH